MWTRTWTWANRLGDWRFDCLPVCAGDDDGNDRDDDDDDDEDRILVSDALDKIKITGNALSGRF